MVLLVLWGKRHAESEFHNIYSEKYEVEDEEPAKELRFQSCPMHIGEETN